MDTAGTLTAVAWVLTAIAATGVLALTLAQLPARQDRAGTRRRPAHATGQGSRTRPPASGTPHHTAT